MIKILFKKFLYQPASWSGSSCTISWC